MFISFSLTIYFPWQFDLAIYDTFEQVSPDFVKGVLYILFHKTIFETFLRELDLGIHAFKNKFKDFLYWAIYFLCSTYLNL